MADGGLFARQDRERSRERRCGSGAPGQVQCNDESDEIMSRVERRGEKGGSQVRVEIAPSIFPRLKKTLIDVTEGRGC